MNLRKKILGYLQLLRLQTAAATALTPVIGALVMGQRDIFLLFILFVIGFLYHVFGFVLNEYIDIDVDKKSVDLKKKPLISGIIPRGYAMFITIFSGFFACFLTIIFFPSLLPILFLLFALLLGGIYDIFGKKIPGLDFALGLGFFFICLMGASTISNNFTILTYLVCLIYFIHIAFNNSVEGGLKDVDHDYLAGAKTLATVLGVSVENTRLKVTNKFAIFSFSLKFIFLVALLCIQPEINLFNFEKNIIQIIMILLLSVIIFFTLYKFLSLSIFDRSKLKKLFSLHEMSSFFALIISISPLIDIWSTIFLIFLPFVWYIFFNFILYGKFLQPQV
jgi:4-hydroxybenzoate polyprenyltransferase